ncbi:hypothetical protein EJB05_31504 [Eragrostis curvula]|uniref:Uncharacterized protein n=1 Tax=Eragrostis curvula TaxID=38414 RepID=A0A5J9UE71_9POAL|nr:hypothetical protein EJB05_31504 [Eragrostis curvula]
MDLYFFTVMADWFSSYSDAATDLAKIRTLSCKHLKKQYPKAINITKSGHRRTFSILYDFKEIDQVSLTHSGRIFDMPKSPTRALIS